MSLVKPHRTRGESNASWYSRRDSYRLELIESQIAELQNAIKKFQVRKK